MLRLTLRQVQVLLAKPQRLDERHNAWKLGTDEVTKAGRKFIEVHINDAVQNLVEGRRWEAKRED